MLRAADPHPSDLQGVDPGCPVVPERAGDVAALVSRVPRAEFAAEPLRRNLNDLRWLERIARAHETVLERVLATSTIVPMRMCTLYASEQSVRGMLERERSTLIGALDALTGRQEWGVKVLVDRERLIESAHARSDIAPELEQELVRLTRRPQSAPLEIATISC